MTKLLDYSQIMSDRKLFNQAIYTHLSEARHLLDERSKDQKLMEKVNKLLSNDIPEILKGNKKYAILFRQIATPNYETKRFVSLAKEHNLHPVIFEFHDDIFSPDKNKFKYSLGKLHVHTGTNQKTGTELVENLSIVDFNEHKGNKISEVKTLWFEPLVDFHKFLLHNHFKDEIIDVWDGSEWCKKRGVHARDYYKYFFLLFVYHGILFENFLSSKDSEGDFTKNVVLPAIEEVINMTGVKPLIVPIEPIDNELDEHWEYHTFNVKKLVKDRKKIKK